MRRLPFPPPHKALKEYACPCKDEAHFQASDSSSNTLMLEIARSENEEVFTCTHVPDFQKGETFRSVWRIAPFVQVLHSAEVFVEQL